MLSVVVGDVGFDQLQATKLGPVQVAVAVDSDTVDTDAVPAVPAGTPGNIQQNSCCYPQTKLDFEDFDCIESHQLLGQSTVDTLYLLLMAEL